MRKLTKDISVEELLEMRNRGMSNKDIARSLDVSYCTILRHIGTEPRRFEKIAALEPVRVREQDIIDPPAPAAQPFFKVGKERLEAGEFVVHLDYEAKSVDIHSGSVHAKVMGYDKLRDLMEVMSHVMARVAKEEV